MKDGLAPVILFAYNRPEHVRRTLESLRHNALAADSHLIIYSDGPRPGDEGAVAQVRKICREEPWCGRVTIVEHEKNLGLADSIVGGITEVLKDSDRFIVLEDDLVLSPGFLRFMNDALRVYENDERVMHVSGYLFPVPIKLPETFFITFAACWGWASWRRAFASFNPDAQALSDRLDEMGAMEQFDIPGTYFRRQLVANAEGRKKTWAVKWHASVFVNRGLCLFPGRSLAQNTGHDETGQHSGRTDRYTIDDPAETVEVKRIALVEDERALTALQRFFRSGIRTRFGDLYLRFQRAVSSRFGKV